MGFHVLVWESGMYDCRAMDSALRSDMPIEKAVRLGVFGLWITGETLPLFEYVRSTWKTSRPLRMTGFDEQFSSRNAPSCFCRDLIAFFDVVGPDFRGKDIRDGSTELAGLMEKCALNPASYEKLSPVLAGAMKSLDEVKPLIGRSWDPGGIAFFRRAGEECLHHRTDGLFHPEGNRGRRSRGLNAAGASSRQHRTSRHLTGKPHLFVDFRRLESDPDHWLRNPIVFGGRGYIWETIEDWTRAFDAVFFNDVVELSRCLPPPQAPGK